MDNGLIFPYPHERAHGEPGDANRPSRRYPFGEKVARAGPEPVLVKRWGDAEGQPRQ
jgi:hypothetical protein